MKALLAEDDDDMREIVRGFLEARGWAVTSLPSGEPMALAHAVASFSLAIVDVRSPIAGGVALVRLLRGAHPTLPIIVTTTFGRPSLEVFVRGIGATEIVEKPFELEALEAALERVVVAGHHSGS